MGVLSDERVHSSGLRVGRVGVGYVRVFRLISINLYCNHSMTYLF